MWTDRACAGDELALVMIRHEGTSTSEFRSLAEQTAQCLASAEYVHVHPEDDGIRVPTFLRVGVAHSWNEADAMETQVRAQIYLAAFGDLDARGAVISKDDPKMKGVPNMAISWSSQLSADSPQLPSEMGVVTQEA